MEAGEFGLIPGLGFAVSMTQLFDVLTLKISQRTFGSIPSFSPSAMPSQAATIFIPRIILFAIFAIYPVPGPPHAKIFLPIPERTWLADKYSSFSFDPTMKVKV